MVKIDFLLCGRRAYDVLQHHVKTQGAQTVRAVATYADKNVLNDPYEEVIAFCNQHNIILKTKENYEADPSIYRFVMGWQRLFTSIDKTIVLHDSLLPKYRGFAPLVNSLINGERELGVTAFLATEGYDEGPVLTQEKIMIDYPLTILEAMEKITPLYAKIVSLLYKKIVDDNLVAAEQDHYLASYSLWRDEQDYKIDWKKSAGHIKRLIDAVGYPYNGTICMLNGEPVKIMEAKIFGDVAIENRTAGKVIFIREGCPVVVCKKGLLKITSGYFTENMKPIIPFTKLRSRFH